MACVHLHDSKVLVAKVSQNCHNESAALFTMFEWLFSMRRQRAESAPGHKREKLHSFWEETMTPTAFSERQQTPDDDHWPLLKKPSIYTSVRMLEMREKAPLCATFVARDWSCNAV